MSAPIPIFYKGKHYLSLSKAAAALGVNRATANQRYRAGLPLKRVFSKDRMPFLHAHSIPVAVGDKTYNSLSQACAALGRSKSIVQGRLRAGWSLGEALTLAPGERRLAHCERTKPALASPVVRGVAYATYKALALAFGVPPGLFYQRLRNKWSIERALGLDPPVVPS